ncbi:MAG: outer membrane protein assembly factor BamD [Nitrospiraceae bacterium]
MPTLRCGFSTRLVSLATASLALLVLAQGCASKPKAADPSGKGLTKTDEQIFLGDTIERNYDPHVIMKRAEAFFDREEYPEAVVELQHFLELHRNHRLASYAQFRLAEAVGRQAKTVDRDPEPVMKAEALFRKLRADFPNSRYDSLALDRIRECQEWLAKTHLFVGKFYSRRGAYLAAAHRYEAILRDYPDMEVAPEAQYQLARTYESLGAKDWAREQLTAMNQRYPTNTYRSEAESLLAQLGGPLDPSALNGTGSESTISSLPKPELRTDNKPTPAATGSTVSAGASGATFTAAQAPPSTPEMSLTGSPQGQTKPAGGSGTVGSQTFCRIGVWC